MGVVLYWVTCICLRMCISKSKSWNSFLSVPLFVATLSSVLTAYAQEDSSGWQEEDGYHWRTLARDSGTDEVGFERLDPGQTGVAFTNLLSEASIAGNRVLPNGSGVALGDYDGDGRVDLFFCGLESPNRLYRNRGGWRFEEVTESAGLTFPEGFYRGAVFADINADHRLDLLVGTLERGVLCFLNKGGGTFEDFTDRAGTGNSMAATTLALADVDGNGTLDLYIANNRGEDIRDRGKIDLPLRNGQVAMPPEFQDRLTYIDGTVLEYGQPDLLMLNDGTGRFTEVDWTGGRFLDEQGEPLAGAPRDWGLAATFHDINGDGLPDLYVCNDYWTPDRIWINQGAGVFRAISREALNKTSASSMGVDFADVNNDGLTDVFVVDMLSRNLGLRKRQMEANTAPPEFMSRISARPQVMRNTFFAARDHGEFAEIAWFSGLEASDWSWSPIFLDVDLDGREDLLISAGHFRDVQDMDANLAIRRRQTKRSPSATPAEVRRQFREEMLLHNRLYPVLEMPIVAFRNLGGFRFEEATDQWGTDDAGIHHGMALGDLDGDGDLDLVCNNLNGPAGLYRNRCTAPRLAVRLVGRGGNTQAVGATVRLYGGARSLQSREVLAGGRYVSGGDTLLSFAPGSAETRKFLEVRWPDGSASLVEGVVEGRLYEVEWPAGGGKGRGAETESGRKRPLFAKIPWHEPWHHEITPSDDFVLQPLAPYRLSERGPGIGWIAPSRTDPPLLVAGNSKNGLPGVFGWEQGRVKSFAWDNKGVQALPGDVTGMAVGMDGDTMVMGLESDDKSSQGLGNLRIFSETRRFQFEARQILRQEGSGHLALGDGDGDGSPELLVLGSPLPGRYPLVSSSRMYRWMGGQWREDSRLQLSLPPGNVPNGAVWTDLDDDLRPELVVACEWGPIRIFKVRQGRLHETTRDWGLDAYEGIWRGVAAGDFDGDGRMDLAASNWGENSPWRASREQPLVAAYGEIFQPGRVAFVEAGYLEDGTLTAARPLPELAESLPFLMQQFSSFKEYAETPLDQVLGERKVLTRQVRATTLASTVFLNRGGSFELKKLPMEAQWAPGFGLSVADFDGDGDQDLFLAQNLSGVRHGWSALDSGLGTMLLGDGQGEFQAMSPVASGIRIREDQRGVAAADFNGDGRMDLAIGIHQGEPVVLENLSGRPGVKVLLQGVAENPAAVGAKMRIRSTGGFGPLFEVRAGHGFWSQDSVSQVLTAPIGEKAKAVHVKWPEGGESETVLEEGVRTVVITHPGKR